MKFRSKGAPKSIRKVSAGVLKIGSQGADADTLRELELNANETLLDCLQRHDIEMFSSCGGFGTCGTCRVTILEGAQLLAVPNEIEAELASDRKFETRERLTCQTRLRADLNTLKEVASVTIELPLREPE